MAYSNYNLSNRISYIISQIAGIITGGTFLNPTLEANITIDGDLAMPSTADIVVSGGGGGSLTGANLARLSGLTSDVQTALDNTAYKNTTNTFTQTQTMANVTINGDLITNIPNSSKTTINGSIPGSCDFIVTQNGTIKQVFVIANAMNGVCVYNTTSLGLIVPIQRDSLSTTALSSGTFAYTTTLTSLTITCTTCTGFANFIGY
jgi:hypothetical protein